MLSEQIFDVSQAQGESVIQPHCMIDNLRRESMASIS